MSLHHDAVPDAPEKVLSPRKSYIKPVSSFFCYFLPKERQPPTFVFTSQFLDCGLLTVGLCSIPWPPASRKAFPSELQQLHGRIIFPQNCDTCTGETIPLKAVLLTQMTYA